MRKTFIMTLVLAFMVVMAGPALAYDFEKPMDKLTTGVVDVLKSPMLIIEHPKTAMEDGGAMGLFKGLIETPFKLVGKIGHGVLDIVTFPVE